MRSLWWPIGMLCILWLCTAVILPAWFDVVWIPRLVLAGLVVLAVTDSEFKWHWCAPLAGLAYDFSAGVMPGTYMLGFSIIYILVRTAFFRFVPSDKVIPALAISFFIVTALLAMWVYIGGVIGSVFNYPVIPIHIWSMPVIELIRTGVGAMATVGIYLVWLEFVHMFSKPIRLRRMQ